MKRYTFIAIGVLIVILLIVGFIKKQSQITSSSKQSVTTEIAIAETFFENNTFGSFIKNSDEAIISTQISGNIKNMYVKEGDIVKKGQILVQINAPEIAAQYAGADAQVKIAQEQEKNARRHWGDYKPEVREQFKLQTRQAEASRSEVGAILQKSRIVAPFDGVVSKKYVTQGETVMPGQQIIYITGATNHQELVINVPVTVGNSVKIGDVVNVTDEVNEVQAQISAVSPVSDQSSRKMMLRIALDENSPFVLGSFVDVTISNDDSIDGVRVSKESVVKQHNDTFVFVVEEAVVHMKNIDVLTESDDFVIITGIDGGGEVINSGAHSMQDSEEVIVIKN